MRRGRPGVRPGQSGCRCPRMAGERTSADRRRNIAAAIWKQPPISPESFDFLVEQGMKDPDGEQIVGRRDHAQGDSRRDPGKIYAHYRPLRVLKDPASAILYNLARAPRTPEEILLELRSDENRSYSGEADANLKRRFPRDPTVSNWTTRMPPFLKVTPLVIKGPGGDALSSDHLVEVVRCGDRGDAFWYQRRIVFVDPAGGAITLVDTSTEDFEIRDLRGGSTWTPFGSPTPSASRLLAADGALGCDSCPTRTTAATRPATSRSVPGTRRAGPTAPRRARLRTGAPPLSARSRKLLLVTVTAVNDAPCWTPAGVPYW